MSRLSKILVAPASYRPSRDKIVHHEAASLFRSWSSPHHLRLYQLYTHSRLLILEVLGEWVGPGCQDYIVAFFCRYLPELLPRLGFESHIQSMFWNLLHEDAKFLSRDISIHWSIYPRLTRWWERRSIAMACCEIDIMYQIPSCIFHLNSGDWPCRCEMVSLPGIHPVYLVLTLVKIMAHQTDQSCSWYT